MVDIIDPLALSIIVDDDGGKVFHKGWPVECEAVLPRIGYSITRRGVAIVRQFEQTGVIVLNSSQGILRSRDKLVACQMDGRGSRSSSDYSTCWGGGEGYRSRSKKSRGSTMRR